MQWLNRWNPFGRSDGRLTYNVSYTTGPDSVDELYTRVQKLGYSTLSYMNVFEFGMNVAGHARGPAVAPKPDDYRNATLYAQNHLQDSILRDNWNAEDRQQFDGHGAWDRGILMDPGRTSYKAEMVAQQQRRAALIPSFQGVVVDRSDCAFLSLSIEPHHPHSYLPRGCRPALEEARSSTNCPQTIPVDDCGHLCPVAPAPRPFLRIAETETGGSPACALLPLVLQTLGTTICCTMMG